MKISKSNLISRIEKGFDTIVTPTGNVPVIAKGITVEGKNSVKYKKKELRVIALLNSKTQKYVPIDSIVDEPVMDNIKSIAVVYPRVGSRWHTDLAFYIYSKLRENFRGSKTQVVLVSGNREAEKAGQYDYTIYIGHVGPYRDEPDYNVKINRYYFIKSFKAVIKSVFKKFGIDLTNFDAELDLVLSLHNYCAKSEENEVSEYEDYYNSIMNLIHDKDEIIANAIKNEYGTDDPFCLYYVFNTILAEAFKENISGPDKGILTCKGTWSKAKLKAKNLNVPFHIYMFLMACKEHYTPQDTQIRNVGLPINILDTAFFARGNSEAIMEAAKRIYPDCILYFEPLPYRYCSTVYLSRKYSNVGYEELVDFLINNRGHIDNKGYISVELRKV